MAERKKPDQNRSDRSDSRSRFRSGKSRTRSAPRKKVYDADRVSDSVAVKRLKTSKAAQSDVRIELPKGPVSIVVSPEYRRKVDTFLKNSTHAHTAFREILQGIDGGFQGEIDGHVLSVFREKIPVSALSITSSLIWYIHSLDQSNLKILIDPVPPELAPRRIECESALAGYVVSHSFMKNLPEPVVEHCIFMELPGRKTSTGPGGHNRFAELADIPKLEKYQDEFSLEAGELDKGNWRELISEKKILLGIYEGNIASIAIKEHETIDRVQIGGVFTFKPFRRRGLATKLISAIVSRAEGRKKSSVLIVGRDNKPMLNLLENLKFAKVTDYIRIRFSL